MVIKKYVVRSMNEAMNKIKHELGNNAVIISQRYVRQKGIKGLFTKKMIEVTAAKDNGNIESKNNIKKEENDALKAIKLAMSKEFIVEKTQTAIKEDKLEIKNQQKSEIYDEVLEMKKILNKLVDDKKDRDIIKNLKDEDVISEIIESLEDKTEIQIKDKLEEILVNSNTDLNGTVVLVGPTGVGKTTTIAKLAGKLSLLENKKVGLITIDTYRIGAVEQLKTYAQIMNITFEVVINLGEMENAIKGMGECDVILIDTTGRSSKNKMQISELRAFVEKAEPDNVSLVLSATTKNKDLDLIIDSYKSLNYNDIIITKIDETSVNGTVLNIAYKSKKPIRFLTTGQNVPNDIKNCSKTEIIKGILGDKVLC